MPNLAMLSQLAGFKKRIIIFSLVGILLTGALVGVTSILPLYLSVKNHIEQLNTVSAKAQASALANQIERYHSIARQFTSRTEIRRRLEAYQQGELSFEALQAFSTPRLAEPTRQVSDLAAMQRITLDGQVVARVGPLAEYIDVIPELNEPLQIMRLPAPQAPMVLVVNAPILNDQQQTVGTDILYFYTDNIEPLLKNFEAYEQKATLCLANIQHEIMLSIDKTTNQPVLLKPTDSERLFLTQFDLEQAALYNSYGEENLSIFYVPFQSSEWGMIIRIPKEALYNPAYNDLTWAILSVMLMLMIGLVLTHYAITPLSKRYLQQAQQIEDASIELQHLAHHDHLTGLPNRHALMQHLRDIIADPKTQNKHFCLLFIDLDSFKPVNDNFGHHIGDQLLQQVALRIKRKVRGTDLVGRLGGDEFLMVIDSLQDPSDAYKVAEKLIENLKRPFDIAQHKIQISASIGLARYPDDGLTVDQLINKADRAMYKAKNQTKSQGRNQIHKSLQKG